MSRQPDDAAHEGFLTRWSRRKQSGDAAPETGTDAPTTDEDGQSPVQPAAAKPSPAPPAGRMITDAPRSESGRPAAATPVEPRPALTDTDMPPLESLDENSDYSGFLSPGVSDRLRKVALRKLFSSAGFNVRDGLDDYDDDYTSFLPLGDTVTADMRHRAEVAERRRQEAEAAEREKRLAAEEKDARTSPEGSAETGAESGDLTDQGESRIARSDAGEGNESPDFGGATETQAEESATDGESAAPGKPERTS